MDKNTATRLIQDVFQKPFNRDRYVTFTKNLFNFLDSDKNFVYSGAYIPDAFRPYIKTLERIGKYEDVEENKIDVLIVHLKKEHSIEHARTMQRNFIAWYLGGSRGGELKDAALVAFYTDNPDDWRFSLVKMDYQIVESPTGKIKTKTELTPARRFSFLVGKSENSHTAQRQLLPTLQDDKNNPLLSDLEKAFNIEVVTQEFFEKYKSLFLDVKDSLDRLMKKDQAIAKDFAEKGVDPVDFSKKLLGQIVFLYFLQKKGWFGVERDSDWGTGPKNFLRLLFEKMIANYKNFFNDILEPLFYEALAKERDDDFYSRFNCKIPFLNGGLFDPLSDYDWVHTDILLPDELFSNQIKTKEGDTGTGILDIFDRYNFTVKEDEPLEKEVAVDPEMLGKVFENLLEVKDRKSKGTYYTPREIVHYMCQESLINYLVNECESKVNRKDIETLIQYGESAVEHDGRVEQEGKETETYSYKLPESVRKNAQLIDDKLRNIRVCDPAIGSAAFPVGMMNEIIRTRNTLTNYLEDKEDRSIYNFKRDAIQNSLYGVDIDPGAVEIAKLRLWLSLVVDEEDIKQIKPLPNLDYKIMQGNSLLEEFEGVKLFDDRLLNSYISINDDQINKLEAREKEIQKNLMTYYQRNPLWMKDQKIERPAELYQLEGELKRVQLAIKDEKGVRFLIKDSNQNVLFGDEQKARKIWEELQSLQKEFFETTQKKEKDELKKQVEKLEWELIEATLKEQDKESSLKKLEQYKKSNIKPFFLWKLHFSEVFQEKGGFDIVIANPPYIRQEEIFNKDELKKEYRIFNSVADLYTYFYERGFKLLRKDGVLTFITSSKFTRARYGLNLRKYLKDKMCLKSIVNFGDKHVFEAITNTLIFIATKDATENNTFNYSDEIKTPDKVVFSQNDLQDSEWTIDKPEVMNLKEKIEKMGIPLRNWEVNINYGLKTGLNEAFLINEETKNNIITKDKKSAEVIKVLIRGRDIGRYRYDKSQQYLLFLPWHFPLQNDSSIVGASNKAEGKFKAEYPHIYSHLLLHKDRLSKRNKNETGIRYEWYALQRYGPNYFRDFIKPKLIWLELTNKNKFAYSDSEDYVLAGAFFMVGKSLKYLLAFLNSKLCYFYFSLICNSSGMATIQWKKFALEKVPIKKLSADDQKPFIEVVDKILAITKDEDYLRNSAKQDEVHKYEDQIDQLVYKLYGLTDEEKKIIAGK